MAPVTAVPVLTGSGALLFGFGLLFVAVAAFGAMLTVGLLHPLLVRYAMARPNARSAHAVPTPQGGGIAVLAALVPAAWLGASALGAEGPTALGFGPGSPFAIGPEAFARLWTALGATVLVGVVGAVDDLRPLPPLPRLALQLVAAGLAVAALPDGARVLPWIPLGVERTLLVVGGAWFVNLTNFMDGMDWLTVADAAPVAAALSVFWFFGFVSAPAGLVSLSLLGALLGFAPFNRPVARLFLGDVGSLSIGLLLAYGLFDLAAHGGLAAAVLLPLYPILDSGLTLLWRLRRREPVWQAHRHHFYQVAVARGLPVRSVLVRVAAANAALVGLAAASLAAPGPVPGALAVAAGVGTVAMLLRSLARGRAAAAVPSPGV